MRKRKFTEKSTEEFKYFLHYRLQEDTFLCNNINTAFNAFMSMSIYIYHEGSLKSFRTFIFSWETVRAEGVVIGRV